MVFAHGWFEFLSDFLKKIAKMSKMGNWVKSGLHYSEGHLCRGEAERLKRPPLIFAAARHCSHGPKFLFCFRKPRICAPIV